MTTRVTFLECGGNSAPLFSPEPLQANLQALHGLASCAEWTGVKLSTLLDEAGVDPKAKWFVAEGADAPHLPRSVPLERGLDDAMIALYRNGERIMPASGYRCACCCRAGKATSISSGCAAWNSAISHS
jgi:sulfane dehydrogenase subunit SoxC